MENVGFSFLHPGPIAAGAAQVAAEKTRRFWMA